jgi:hypothetical protein
MPLQLNGIEAWITLENKVHVQELHPEVDEETGVATCWISGEPGQPFVIRWRDMSDPTTTHQHDYSGFVTMDGYELGGRVLHARSYASAIFSQIPTSATSSMPLTFSNLPRTAGIGPDWQTLGTISIDVHVVEVGEGNRLHEGYSHYYRRDEGSPLSSAKPHCSTEVTSLRKIATFTFKYRPLDILQEYGIAPVVAPQTPLRIATTGDKRSAPEYDSDDDDGSMYSPVTPDTPSLTFSSGGSDSDSSQDWRPIRSRPRRHSKSYHYGPQAKRMKIIPY